ncbi:hypothetical protein SH584_08805 [Sphingomonas sp. LY29]|uniref:hypothetical protein n=1 Tax=Sphingomonas sp. LY29 TaxID=3095341 RepID=UPI002D780647|nr:hypothetical protein [Sphingomonas sp. LY29]WRP25147.1 hypothetical protein SH584_08805 [Sphingomonas sp. LY29]
MLSKPELKEILERVILAQGNSFIKELARSHGIKIGANKDEFRTNLNAAIDNGELDQEKIEAWLAEVEGWGNQHFYLYEAPAISSEDLVTRIKGSAHAALLGSGISFDFADELRLTAILVDHERLSMVWQQGKDRWSRYKQKDFTEEEGNEFYRFEAYLRHGERSIVRFEWRFEDAFCGILIHRNKEIKHAEAIAQVWKEVAATGVAPARLPSISLNEAVKTKSKGEGAQSSRFDNDEGYVEMGSKKADGGIDEIEAVRQAREGLDDEAFDDTRGMFHYKADGGKLSVAISVQVFGKEGCLRLWARCLRSDVYQLVRSILDANQA